MKSTNPLPLYSPNSRYNKVNFPAYVLKGLMSLIKNSPPKTNEELDHSDTFYNPWYTITEERVYYWLYTMVGLHTDYEEYSILNNAFIVTYNWNIQAWQVRV